MSYYELGPILGICNTAVDKADKILTLKSLYFFLMEFYENYETQFTCISLYILHIIYYDYNVYST